jgi:hypothetical protein
MLKALVVGHRPGGARSVVLALWLTQAAAACAIAPAAPANLGAPFVLTTRGDPVRATPPPGVEVTLGAKRVLSTVEPSRSD